MLLRVSVIILSLVTWTCVAAEDAYGDPQLGCGDPLIAQEGSEATLSVTFDVGDRPAHSYTLTICKPGQCDYPPPWIMCGWLGNDHYNHHNACNDGPTLSKILGSTYQLKQIIPNVRKGDSGNYSVVLTVSTNEKEIIKKCDIVLLVTEVYGDPQLECGDTVTAQEGSEATLSVTYDVGDRPLVNHVLTIDKPGRFGNAQHWIMCEWLKNEEYNQHSACNEGPTLSKILHRTYQLTTPLSNVRKGDSGNYPVSLTVTTDEKVITKKCDIVLLVVEASTTAVRDPEKDHLHTPAAESESEKEESMVIGGVVIAAVVGVLLCLGAWWFYRRRQRRSHTNDLTSVTTEGSTTNSATDPPRVSTQQPPQGNENGTESIGLLGVPSHNSTERTSSPSPLAGNGLAHGASGDGTAGSTKETTSLMPSTVRQRSREPDKATVEVNDR